jgi:tungstate transport system substrate-binding protein
MTHTRSELKWTSALVTAFVFMIVLFACRCAKSLAAEPARRPADVDSRAVVRCAVIGGMTDTGFWEAISNRFRNATGIQVEVVVTGPKHEISEPFRRGEADLITMHASDTIINLVADGFGMNPQPWARNDLLLVGPKDDPAKVKGTADAVAALKRIIETKSKLLVHQSLGTNEVLHDLLAEGGLEIDTASTVVLPSDRHRQLLQRAARENAYTIVGRIPFLNGKIANDGLEIMVQGDPRMRRPYVVVVSCNDPDSPRHTAACRLADYLRHPETQKWIADFGRGKLDDHPLFFPVVIPQQVESHAQRP